MRLSVSPQPGVCPDFVFRPENDPLGADPEVDAFLVVLTVEIRSDCFPGTTGGDAGQDEGVVRAVQVIGVDDGASVDGSSDFPGIDVDEPGGGSDGLFQIFCTQPGGAARSPDPESPFAVRRLVPGLDFACQEGGYLKKDFAFSKKDFSSGLVPSSQTAAKASRALFCSALSLRGTST